MPRGCRAAQPAQKKKRAASEHAKLLKQFGCKLCAKVVSQPLSTPCGHTFCKSCLTGVFNGVSDTRERAATSGRTMREQKTNKPCPTCKARAGQRCAPGRRPLLGRCREPGALLPRRWTSATF